MLAPPQCCHFKLHLSVRLPHAHLFWSNLQVLAAGDAIILSRNIAEKCLYDQTEGVSGVFSMISSGSYITNESK